MTNSNYLTDCILYQICKIFLVYYKKRETLPDNTAKNTVILWCGNFMERHSFCIVSGESPKTMRKLCLSTKFPQRKLGKITVFQAV